MTHDPSLKIRDCEPDFDNMADVVDRRVGEWRGQPTGVAYFTPDVTITADSLSHAFMRAVRKYQGRWAKRSETTFPRWARKSVRNWVSPKPRQSKYEKFLERAFCFTGVLLVNGKILPPHEWPDRHWPDYAPNRTEALQPSG